LLSFGTDKTKLGGMGLGSEAVRSAWLTIFADLVLLDHRRDGHTFGLLLFA
jgi:hypothetical protein